MQNISSELAEALTALRSSMNAEEVRKTFATTYREIREDNVAHGLPADGPFWDMASDERTHVFAFFDAAKAELYVFEFSDFWALRTDMDLLTMAEVTEMRKLLHDKYGVGAPLVSLDHEQAARWLHG